MAEKPRPKRGRGRPAKPTLERLSERTMVRLDPLLRAAIDLRRKQLEEEKGLEPGELEMGFAIRSMLREAAVARRLLDPSALPA